MPPPQRVAQNDDMIPARDCVVPEKRSAEGRPDAEQLEGSNADRVARYALGLIRRVQVHRRARDERDALKHARVGRPIDQAGWVDVELPAVRGAEMLDEQREALRLRERQGTVEQGVDDREDGGIGADADREREDGDGGEPAAAGELAERRAEVLEHARASGLRVRASSPPDPLSLRERGNSGRPPSPERRGGQGVSTRGRGSHSPSTPGPTSNGTCGRT